MENLYNEKARRIFLYDKAKEIAENLGEYEYTPYASGSSVYYKDCTYTGYGFKIVIFDKKRVNENGICVYFNNNCVLDLNTYVKGPWEEVLNELHQSINAILMKKEEDKIPLTIKNSMLVTLKSILRYGVIDVDAGLKIVAEEHCTGAYDECYEGSWFKVYQDGLMVFYAYYAASDYFQHIHIRYISGPWEDKIKRFAEYYKIELKKIEQNQKDESIVNENIRKLKKLRGDF